MQSISSFLALDNHHRQDAIGFALETLASPDAHPDDLQAIREHGKCIIRRGLVPAHVDRRTVVALRAINPAHDGKTFKQYIADEFPGNERLIDQFEDAVSYWVEMFAAHREARS